ncbi:hypothetical protein [Saccharibacillus qingshengii]|uniref:hypothetical protein n=1 Tax=Saccharibacillus qingshengii TaxID=1763540 RepID=UPI001555C747|nr:hypothetical protein [Saccharibacillus qingshengii]
MGTQNDVVFSAKYDATIMLGGTVNTNIQPISYKTRKTDSGGSMVSFKLPESSLNFLAQNARGYMSYHTKVSNTNETITSVSGYYKHKVKNLSVTPTINWPLGGGLTISSSNTYVDETPPPYFSLEIK